jgi:hypothetical protein
VDLMSDPPRREARLRPEFAELYPGITGGQWESATALMDRMIAWLLLHHRAVGPATGRILPAQHFEFRGEAAPPPSSPQERTRREDLHKEENA